MSEIIDVGEIDPMKKYIPVNKLEDLHKIADFYGELVFHDPKGGKIEVNTEYLVLHQGGWVFYLVK